MARFNKIYWRGGIIISRPLGFRKFFPRGCVFPYFEADKIKFKIRVKKQWGENKHSLCQINKLKIFEVMPDEKTRELTRNKDLGDDAKSCIIDNESYTREGTMQYVLGQPGGADSHPLIEAKVYSTDTAWLYVILPIIGGLVGVVVGVGLKFLIDCFI